jgi:hypothetical protein
MQKLAILAPWSPNFNEDSNTLQKFRQF